MPILIGLLVAGLIYYLSFWPKAQLFGHMTWRVKTDQKIVALTFDDGPNEPYTSLLLDLLDEENVKATFFVVGSNVKHYPDVVKRIASSGHGLGNHSMSHRFSNYLLHPSFKTEIASAQAAIAEVIGQGPELYRSPWLFRTPWLLHSVKEAGLVPVSGQFAHPFEVLQPSAEAMAKTSKRLIRPGSIIIFHDGFDARGGRRDQSVKAAKILIKQLKAEGYRFVTVEELLSLRS